MLYVSVMSLFFYILTLAVLFALASCFWRKRFQPASALAISKFRYVSEVSVIFLLVVAKYHTEVHEGKKDLFGRTSNLPRLSLGG